jgi:hypothetical protein
VLFEKSKRGQLRKGPGVLFGTLLMGITTPFVLLDSYKLPFRRRLLVAFWKHFG